jgi:hypothetical protein
VKSFLPERQWLEEIVFCALAEREVFWKVTLSANIAVCEICSKKSWSYACYPKIAPSSIMSRFSAKLTHAALGSLPEAERKKCPAHRRKVPLGAYGVPTAGVASPIPESDREPNRAPWASLKESVTLRLYFWISPLFRVADSGQQFSFWMFLHLFLQHQICFTSSCFFHTKDRPLPSSNLGVQSIPILQCHIS